MIGLIVARSKNNVIGKDGKIPWNIKGELSQFKELTTGNAVIMGRKSYEEVGHPLPNRLNIVVSNTKEFKGENLITVHSLQEAFERANGKDVYVAGGYRLFKEVIPMVDKMYITEIDIVIEDGDVFFPEFNFDEFDLEIGETIGEEIQYTRTIYTRKKLK
ncbi:MAG: dihydrofolate reductase [Parabacteroides sp.]|nr:dihydrofolate reductase [Parabacteroides sp.]